MFTLTKQFRFEASHVLPQHEGKCGRLHGHSWIGRVFVQADELIANGPKAGMVTDFADLSMVIRPLVDDFLDHRHLNETTKLANPTSETIARWIFEKLHLNLRDGVKLIAVEVDETCTSSCRYQP